MSGDVLTVTLETELIRVTAERRKAGDSTAEIGFHLRDRTFDLLLPALGTDLHAQDIAMEALALVDWGKIAERIGWKITGVNPWMG